SCGGLPNHRLQYHLRSWILLVGCVYPGSIPALDPAVVLDHPALLQDVSHRFHGSAQVGLHAWPSPKLGAHMHADPSRHGVRPQLAPLPQLLQSRNQLVLQPLITLVVNDHRPPTTPDDPLTALLADRSALPCDVNKPAPIGPSRKAQGGQRIRHIQPTPRGAGPGLPLLCSLSTGGAPCALPCLSRLRACRHRCSTPLLGCLLGDDSVLCRCRQVQWATLPTSCSTGYEKC